MRRRTKWLIAAASTLVLLIFFGIFAYLEWEPGRHFRPQQLPVLVAPQKAVGMLQAGSPLGEQANSAAEPSAPSQAESLKLDGFNLLLLGIDARGAESSRTDVLMLIHVDPELRKVRLLSIPRDTRVQLPGIGYTKINHAHILGERKSGSHAGTEAALQAVSNLCSCKINYYVKTDFAGFERFVDKIGGLDLELDEPVTLTYAQQTLPKGEVHLNGETALHFVRERRSLPGGDQGRQEHQAQALKALINKLLEPRNLLRIKPLIEEIREDLVDTNLEDGDLVSLAWLAKDLKGNHLSYDQLPGEGKRAWDPMVKAELYYWVPDMTEWEKLRKAYSVR
ncbi:LytR family transcriptional regulator [Paenibacillus sp. CAA11]|uniref:LCP family protein n=1 Tax=Paenibacillus sp. CAA11 TaxID=1532905 RepID=UPI000D3B04A3|nr:LCP family protein [Paenibacillus sp. CAA11]AWB46404.1 LytR family transcriptional regulator [Paenibacillus sp. CAA11]